MGGGFYSRSSVESPLLRTLRISRLKILRALFGGDKGGSFTICWRSLLSTTALALAEVDLPEALFIKEDC